MNSRINLELIRDLLLFIENYDLTEPHIEFDTGMFYPYLDGFISDNKKYCNYVIMYHYYYLKNGGLLVACFDYRWVGDIEKNSEGFRIRLEKEGHSYHNYSLSTPTGNVRGKYPLIAMTYKGHEFLNSIKNKKTWNKLLKMVKKRGGAIVLDVVTNYAIQQYKAGIVDSLFGFVKKLY